MPINLKDLLRHTVYSVGAGAPTGPADSIYEGRTRITSRSDRVQAGVFVLPHNNMEAIVVDYEKDPALKDYILEMEKYLMAQKATLDRAGRTCDFATMISMMSHKIAADFPYDKRMTEGNFGANKYPSGKKVHLGVIMRSQNMVCRHMGLLAAAILDYFKENTRQGRGPLTVSPQCGVRFMAETQQDLLEDETGGHAYTVVRYTPKGETKMQYFVIDPTGGRAAEIREYFKKKREPGPGSYRYLFSVLRFVFQNPDTRDRELIERVFELAKKDPKVVGVIKDLEKTLKGNVTSMTIIQGYKAKNAIK